MEGFCRWPFFYQVNLEFAFNEVGREDPGFPFDVLWKLCTLPRINTFL